MTAPLKTTGKPVFISVPTGTKESERTKDIGHFAAKGISCILGDVNKAVQTADSLDKLIASMEKQGNQVDFSCVFLPEPYWFFDMSDLLPRDMDTTDTSSALENLGKKRAFSIFSKKIKDLDPSTTFIINSPKAKFLSGRSVKEFADNRGLEIDEAFKKLIEVAGIDISFSAEMRDRSVIDKLILHPRSVIGSSLWSPMSSVSEYHSNISRPFSEFFRRANSLGAPIESVVKKTASTARILGLKKRGLIKNGWVGDIAVLKDGPPDYVIVGGELAVDNGQVTGSHSGEIIN
jgi:hypothetical protein